MRLWLTIGMSVVLFPAPGWCQRTPAEAVAGMKLPPGFSIRCVAHEPMVRQPVSIAFDAKGRLWVLQYLQYPNYAGLKPVKQDQYLRTIWDRVPEPPPRGPKGADKITILYDPDENGVFRKSKDFVTGLNIASGFCLGHGGVYVAQPPYLLFYPDRDGDDVPDSDPEVLLEGFGMDDTHSLANHLKWGPDGWLYGAAGSTSTSRIRNPHHPHDPVVEFQQGIWRFHPVSKKFELFSEGGGNTYGLDFDRHGQLLAGTNWGGFALLHQMQGAYYVKGFAKHGPLHNPHTYGYFDHVPYRNFKGGHVTCGGIVYEAETYPEHLRHQYVACNLLSNAIYWHKLEPVGASFRAEHGGELVETDDVWFRPVDLCLGPDGCIYVADWYDRRAAHLDPIDNWHKSSGRIYRIEYGGGPRYPRLDLTRYSSAELLELLHHPNKWYRGMARQLLAERRDPATYAPLRRWLVQRTDTLALEALWTLYVSGGWSKVPLTELLNHPHEQVRGWAVRLAVDQVGTPLPTGLSHKPGQDRSPVVLAQLACSARRMTPEDALVALHQLQRNPVCARDSHLPLLIWWGIEEQLSRSLEQLRRHGGASPAASSVERFIRPWVLTEALPEPAGERLRQDLLEKMARRLSAADAPAQVLAALWPGYPSSVLLRGLAQGLEGRALPAVPEPLRRPLEEYRRHHPDDPLLRVVLARMGDPTARNELRQLLANPQAAEPDRLTAIRVLRQIHDPSARPLFQDLLLSVRSDPLRLALLEALEAWDDPAIASLVLQHYASFSPSVQKRAVQLLLSRPVWAVALFRAWEAKQLPATHLGLDHARAAIALQYPPLTELVEKHFGKLTPATPGEKQARIAWLQMVLAREKDADPVRGKALFGKLCAACHQLHGQGGKVGPDLTTADRTNRLYLLTHIVDPSAYIRPEYLVQTILTHDERRLSGIATDQGETILLTTVVNDQPVTLSVPKADIADIRPSPVSLMPERLLDGLSDREVADLFAYLQSPSPSAARSSPDSSRSASPGAASPVPPRRPLRIALISGSFEYKSDASLQRLQKMLEQRYAVECLLIAAKDEKDTTLPGLERLKECDLAIFFTRRLRLQGEALEMVKAFARSDKPILGLRTASHGFQNWLEMDAEIFGGSYQGHYGAGPVCQVRPAEQAKDHPVLRGVQPFRSPGSLYKNPRLAPDATVLLYGTLPDGTSEPVAWARTLKGRRIFYTSLGHPDDFNNEQFLRLLFNALEWLHGQPLPPRR
ncbi:MAG: ThuA domain-containing protein [Gemmataceae bacterium]|nr:ThuA domain-containing protein [Gemmataceae bacterium]